MTTHATRPTRWPAPLLLLALLTGPVAMGLGTIVDTTTGPDIGKYIAAVQNHPGSFLASGFLTQYGMLALIPMAVAVFQLSAGAPRARLLRAGAALYATYGALASSAVALGYTAGVVLADPALAGLTEAQRDAAFLGIGSSVFATVAQVAGVACMAVGLLLMGIGLLRSKLAPWWAAVLVMATVLVLVFAPLEFRLAGQILFFALPVGLAVFAASVLRSSSPSTLVPAPTQ